MSQGRSPEVIPVWPGHVPDNDLWRDVGPELERPRLANSRLVRNVSRPTLTVFLPEPSLAVGTGGIVCPGGAFHFLMVDKEGSEVARWLNSRGVAPFVLKYRVLSTPDDDEAFGAIAANPTPHRPQMDRVRPMVVADGLQALRTLRNEASRWEIAPDRLGIMGFSAGAHAAAGIRAELHLYAQGGHGFALVPQGLPVDGWIDRFWEWLRAEGFVPSAEGR